jgi:predicted SpoU family rRNA methylase
MRHIKLFESFSTEELMIFDYNQSELNKYEKEGLHCITFYPRRSGGSSFTIAKKQDVLDMRDLLSKAGISISLGNVGFGPYYHNGSREPKSMVVIVRSEKDKEIVYDIIDRNFSLNYPTHQLGGW